MGVNYAKVNYRFLLNWSYKEGVGGRVIPIHM